MVAAVAGGACEGAGECHHWERRGRGGSERVEAQVMPQWDTSSTVPPEIAQRHFSPAPSLCARAAHHKGARYFHPRRPRVCTPSTEAKQTGLLSPSASHSVVFASSRHNTRTSPCFLRVPVHILCLTPSPFPLGSGNSHLNPLVLLRFVALVTKLVVHSLIWNSPKFQLCACFFFYSTI
jgi:hypothetical protein